MRLSLSDLARFSVSFVLLAGAALKLRQILGGDFDGLAQLQSALIVWEAFLALWLVCGVYWRAATRVAIVTFAAFAGVSLAKALGGERSCGCFGEIEFSPWIILVADSCIVLVLARFRRQMPTVSRRTAVAVSVMLLVGFATPVLLPASGTPESTLGDVLPAELRKGTWEITVVRPTCLACVAHLHEHRAKPNGGSTKQALLILGAPQPWLEEFYNAFDAHFTVSPRNSARIRTPQRILVENATIVHLGSPSSRHER